MPSDALLPLPPDRIKHPLFYTQTSSASQTDTMGNSQRRENYAVGSVIAQGWFAAVKECHNKLSRKEYSLRVVGKARVFGQEDLIRKECEVLRIMKHENVVQVVDSWETSDEICFVMEQIEVSWRENKRRREAATLT